MHLPFFFTNEITIYIYLCLSMSIVATIQGMMIEEKKHKNDALKRQLEDYDLSKKKLKMEYEKKALKESGKCRNVNVRNLRG